MIPGQREGFRGNVYLSWCGGVPGKGECVLPLPGIFLEVVAGLLARLGDHAVATACLVVSGEVFGTATIEAPMQAPRFGFRGIGRKDDAQPPLAGLMALGNGRHVQDALAGYSGLFPILAGSFRIVGKEGIKATGGTVDAGRSFGNVGDSHNSLLRSGLMVRPVLVLAHLGGLFLLLPFR